MANTKMKLCKTKTCRNPVIVGDYCEHCKQTRKETGNKAKVILGAVGIPAIGFAIKNGALKKIPKLAKTALNIVLKR